MSGSTGDAPVLEGEHRLGEGMRRGVFCLGLVPVATGLTLREAMWMQCCLTAGVEPGRCPRMRSVAPTGMRWRTRWAWPRV